MRALSALLQIIFGVMPALVLTVMALFIPVVHERWMIVFCLGAAAGTAGLCWALMGYEQRFAKWVVLLLIAGGRS
jgi:hypothetical protein